MKNTIKSNEFHATFMLSKTKVFSVNYYTLGNNKEPYFTTSATVFNRPKTDYNRCGQCQNDVLIGYSEAMKFYKKWDVNHLKKLSDTEYLEMISDLEILFKKYPYLLNQKEDDNLRDISFRKLKDFSMSVYR